MRKFVQAVACILLLSFSPVVLAHGGKTDASGCHTEKKTGDYHCHGGGAKTAKTEARSEAPHGKSSVICEINAYNCSDFHSHAEAQSVYEHCIAEAAGDIHDLDRDDDGDACEALQ